MAEISSRNHEIIITINKIKSSNETKLFKNIYSSFNVENYSPAESANSSRFMAGNLIKYMAESSISRRFSGVDSTPCRIASAAAQVLAAYIYLFYFHRQ